MHARKQISKTHAAHPVRQKKSARNNTPGFSDNRPEAFLLKKMQQTMEHNSSVLQKRENKTGLPDQLKTGVENLSGYALDDVKVHYNSGKPAQLQAHAYAQGTDIHLAPGQEKHLPHEAWHVVQQKQGRVKSTMQMKGGVHVNDDAGLEREADVMGAKAMELKAQTSEEQALSDGNSSAAVVQQMPDWMLKLIGLAKENKWVAGGTAITVGGILLYYYCREKPGALPPQVEKEVKEEKPTYETLEDLAKAIGVEIEVLRDQLETGMGDKVTVQEFYNLGLDSDIFVPLLVHPNLITGLPEGDDTKFAELLTRFHKFEFTYTGNRESGGSGFLQRNGDCCTLVQMFIYATRAAGIEGVEMKSNYNYMLVPATEIHGRDGKGNVDGELCWSFADHHWCEYKGVCYDLLFKKTGAHATSFMVSENEYDGIKYSVFDNEYAIIYPDMFSYLKTNLSEGKEGYVATSENQIIKYIQANKK